MKLGFDLSSWEGKDGAYCDFAKARYAGIEWASLNVTDGLVKDSAYKANWTRLRMANIRVMPYHYFFHRTNPLLQAQNFIASLVEQNYAPLDDLMPCLDLENYGTNLAYRGVWAQCRIFLDEVEKAFGVRPCVYTSPSFITSFLHSSLYPNEDLRNYDLFLAHYKVAAPLPPDPYYPNDAKLRGWQMGDSFSAGIYGFDRNYVKEVALQWLYT